MTIEAALIVPLILIICSIFIQYGLYFVMITEAKYICDDEVRQWGRSEEASSDDLELGIQKRLDEIMSFDKSEIVVNVENQIISKTAKIQITTVYHLFFDIPVFITGYGSKVMTNEFVRFSDWAFHVEDLAKEFFQKGNKE